MPLNSPVTELTTAATDLVLGVVSIAILIQLQRVRQYDEWKVKLWSWVFALLALVSFLGTVAHGFQMSDSTRYWLWQPLYTCLGIMIALFVVGAVNDWRGKPLSRRLLIPAVVLGVGFYALTVVLGGKFLVFVVYEGAAMLVALVIYIRLSIKSQMPGSGMVAGAIGLNIAAAAVQASSLSVTIILPLDHNGLFHMVQIAAIVMLGRGLRTSLQPA
ncbi:MAG: hypothetical protein O7G86_04330 [Gammaproteobacteria bacterium]|nr:hypothetical protein [Gammaproteobacteria bacterium]